MTRRPDIQILRAAAALGVVLFHLWPTRVPGGFVGVDVFFVISGFLITAGLLRETDATGRIALFRFWGRRARRLLPAGLLVIAVSLAAVIAWAPATVWRDWSWESVASALYFENWALAAKSVDYWAEGAAASPFQHYWSLSVEEQFYIAWPVLLLAGAALAGRRGFFCVVGILGVASLAYASLINGPALYFDTFARVWEFAFGALAVAIPSRIPFGARVPLVAAGWIAILAGFVLLTGESGVPGPAALLPALGTVAVIAGQVTPAPRPIAYLGDISYPIYLWHWPLIVLAPDVFGHRLDGVSRVVILLATIALASATHHFVETPIRTRARLAASTIAVAMLLVIGISVTVSAAVTHEQEKDRIAVRERLESDPCFGAVAALNDCPPSAGADLLPSIANWQADIPRAPDCYAQSNDAPTVTCTFGSGPIRVAVIGNSHGELLVEGFRPYLDEFGWTIDTYIGRGSVYRWGDGVPDRLISEGLARGDYDLVIASYNRADEQYYLTEDSDSDPRTDALVRAFTEARDLGVPVVALGDNPTVPQAALNCVASAADPRDCSFSTVDGLKFHDPLRTAAELTGSAMIQFDDIYCSPTTCPMVIGDVIVYRDENHLTATFAMTIAPLIMEAAETAAGLR